jgi:hypothetical protein
MLIAEMLLPLSVCGPIGAALIAALLWFARRDAAREKANDDRHAEVVALTRETITAFAEVKAAVEELRHGLPK